MPHLGSLCSTIVYLSHSAQQCSNSLRFSIFF